MLILGKPCVGRTIQDSTNLVLLRSRIAVSFFYYYIEDSDVVLNLQL